MQRNLKEIIHGKVDIQIGKKGLNEGVVDQIIKQFKHREFLKIRFLDIHQFNNIKEASHNLCDITNSKLIETRGKTCVIKRKQKHS